MSNRQVSSSLSPSRKLKQPAAIQGTSKGGQGQAAQTAAESSSLQARKARSERLMNSEGGMFPGLPGSAALAAARRSSVLVDDIPTCIFPPSIHEIHQRQFYDVDLRQRDLTHYDDIFGVEDFLKQLKAMMFLEKFYGNDDVLIASIDAKWVSNTPGRVCVSLLTIGISNEVFIFDLMNMRTRLHDTSNPWVLLADGFFRNRNILKIGYQIQSLLRMLSSCSVAWMNLENEILMCLDLQQLGDEFLKQNSEFFPYSAGIVGQGLSELVRVCFGKPLSWMDLHSKWELRPLPSSIVDCSSIVAISLLDVFGVMVTRADELNIDLEAKLFSVLGA